MPRRSLKAFLSRARYWQPFNWLATSCLKAAFRIAGVRPFPRVVRHLHRVGTIEVRVDGQRLLFWSPEATKVTNEMYWGGREGIDQDARLFAAFARSAATVVDVGAYVGVYSLLAAARSPSARILAFEPLPRVFARLAHNCALNQADNVELFPLALANSDNPSFQRFYQLPGARLPSSSGFRAETLAQGVAPTLVPAVAFDAMAREMSIDRVDLIKLDTEGTEPQVLHGMRSMIEASRPTIFCEVLETTGTARELERALPRGYRFYELAPGSPVPRAAITPINASRNYLFTCLPHEAVVQAATSIAA